MNAFQDFSIQQVLNHVVNGDEVESSEFESVDVETQLGQDIDKLWREEETGGFVQPFDCVKRQITTFVRKLKEFVVDT